MLKWQHVAMHPDKNLCTNNYLHLLIIIQGIVMPAHKINLDMISKHVI